MPATTMPASNTMLAWDNYILTAGLTATSQALPVTNLQSERGAASIAWQTSAGVVTNAIVTIRPQTMGSVWRAFGVFRTNLTAYAQIGVTLYNSPNLFVWGASVEGPEPGYYQSVLVTPTDITADYATIEIDDPGNPDGFINVPLAYAGSAWQAQGGISYDTTFGYDSRIDEVVTIGGQEYPNLRWDRRRAELAFTTIRGGEVAGPLAELQTTARRGNNCLFIPDITSDTLKIEAIYGRLTATADIGFPYGGSDRRSWRARITERL